MSQQFTSAAAFFAAANGKRVRKVVTGVATAADWPAIRDNIVSQLLAQGCAAADIIEDETCLKVRTTGQFWMRPKVVGDECGVLTVRSADYGFTPECGRTNGKPIMGDKRGAKIEGGSLVKRYDNGMIVTLTIEGAA